MVCEGKAIRRFRGIDLNQEEAPEATTRLKPRRRLETYKLTQSVFNNINLHSSHRGFLMRAESTVDGTLIAATLSTKNGSEERDPEMRQPKKGNQWSYGMKEHIAVDVESGLVLRSWPQERMNMM